MPIKEFQTRRVIKYQPLRFPKYVKDANDTTVYPAEVLKALVKELSKLYDNVVVLSPEYFVKKDNGGSLIDTYAFFDPDFTEEEFKTLMDNFLSQYDGHVTYKIKRFPKSARLQYGYVENFYKLSKDEERIGTATNLFRHKYKKEADLDSKKDQEELIKLKRTFVAIDRDHTGFINLKELETAFQMLNIEISNKDIHKIYEAASEQKGSIDYSQFLIDL